MHACEVASVVSDSVQPVNCSPPGSSMGFSRQEYWSGLPFPSPGDLPNPGIKPAYPTWQADSLPLSQLRSPISKAEFSKFGYNGVEKFVFACVCVIFLKIYKIFLNELLLEV